MSLSASRIIQRFQGNAQRARADARQIAMEMCSRAPKNDIEAASLLISMRVWWGPTRIGICGLAVSWPITC